MIIEGTKENFKKEVLQSNKPVVIDFNAAWCGPCRMLAPVIENIAKEKENIKVISINIDQEEELAEQYNVYSIPCLVYIKDGKEIKRNVGLLSKSELEEWMEE